MFHILDPAEIEFPYKDASRFQDLESGEEVPVVPEVFADQYRKMMQEHIQALTTKCSEVRIDYVLLQRPPSRSTRRCSATSAIASG